MPKPNESSVTTIDDTPAITETPAATMLRVVDDGDQLSGERVELTIPPGDGENGRDPVFIGLNGTGYQIPRGVPVNVPAELVEILNNARPTIYEASGTTMRAREVQRFAYNTRQVAKAV